MSVADLHVNLVGLIIALALCSIMAVVFTWGLRGRTLASDTRRPDAPSAEPRILLPVIERMPSARAVELAGYLAGAQKGEIILLCVVEVPWTLPLIAGRRELEARAHNASETASAIEGRYGVFTRVRLALERTAAEAILRVAREEEADAVVMSIEAGTSWRRRREASIARRVLASASCEVIIDEAPRVRKDLPGMKQQAPSEG